MPETNLAAAKLQAIMALYLDAMASGDEAALQRAREGAARIQALSDADAQSLLPPDVAAGGEDDEEPDTDAEMSGNVREEDSALPHARGDFLDVLRYDALRVPGGRKLGERSGGQFVEAKALAEFYASLFSSLTDAGSPPDDSEVDKANDELEPHGWSVEQDEDDVWEAVALDEDGKEPIQHKRVKAGTAGAIEKTDKRGHKYYIDKETVKTTSAQRTAARDEARKTRGPVNRDELKSRLATSIETHEANPVLSPVGMQRVKRALGALTRYHGEHALHRVEELTEQVEKALAKLKANPPKEKIDEPAHRQKLTNLREELSRLHGMVGVMEEREKSLAVPAKPKAPSRSPLGVPPSKPDAGAVYNVATEHILTDPSRFQYKMNVDTSGVTQELKQVKTWNPDFAGVVSVWLDPADGKTYTVNGHHRRELAGRLGVGRLAVRYIDAKDAKEARGIGAIINIAEGRGTALDAAKFMRDVGASPEDLASRGVSLQARMATDAATLTRLSDRAFDKLARGQMDEGRALAVAKHLGNHQFQDQLFSLLDKREDEGKDITNKVVEEMARKMASLPTTKTTEKTLFGDIESEESTFVPASELQAYVRGQLSQEVNDWLAVASKRRAEKVGAQGNVLDTEKNREIAARAEEAKYTYDTLVNSRGPIADAINAGAAELMKAKGRGERDAIKKRTLETVRDAILREDSGQTQPGGAGPVDGGGTAAGTGQPAGGAEAVPPDVRRGDVGEAGLTPPDTHTGDLFGNTPSAPATPPPAAQSFPPDVAKPAAKPLPTDTDARLVRDDIKAALKDHGSVPFYSAADEGKAVEELTRAHPELKPYDVGAHFEQALRDVAARRGIDWSVVEDARDNPEGDRDRNNLAFIAKAAWKKIAPEVNGDKELLLHGLGGLERYGLDNVLHSIHGIHGLHDPNQRENSAVVVLPAAHDLAVPAGKRVASLPASIGGEAPAPEATPTPSPAVAPLAPKVGQTLTYTGKAGAMPAEFRGFHDDPNTGEKVARVIVRPETGPPFEASVKLSELSAAPAAKPAAIAPPRVGDKVHIPGGANTYPMDFDVKKVEGGKVALGYSYSPHVAVEMPIESYKHFINDLTGKVDVPPDSGNRAIDAVASGKAEFLGKGDDGLAFRDGNALVKVSTTVPYQPTNPGHRTPQEAADRLKQQTETSEEMRKAGIPGILPTKFVQHGDKGFQIKPYVEVPEKFTSEQVKQVRGIMDAMHEKGYVVGDEVQVGLFDGKPYIFDLGKAQKSRHKHDLQDDSDRFERWAEKQGVGRLPLRAEAQRQFDDWKESSEFMPPEESREHGDKMRRALIASGADPAKVNAEFDEATSKLSGEEALAVQPASSPDVPESPVDPATAARDARKAEHTADMADEEQRTAAHRDKQREAALARYASRETTGGGGSLFGADDARSREGFANLPDRTAVVLTEGPRAGQTGKISREKSLDGSERTIVRLDADNEAVPVTHTAVEPLDQWLSWRGAGASAAGKKQGGLFGGAPAAQTPQELAPHVKEHREIQGALNKIASAGGAGTLHGIPVEMTGIGRFKATIGGKEVHGDTAYIASRIQEAKPQEPAVTPESAAPSPPDVATVEPAVPATLPDYVSQHELSRLDDKIASLSDKIESSRRIWDKPNEIPGSFVTGRSNRSASLDKQLGRENDRKSAAFKEYQEAKAEHERLQQIREGYLAGRNHPNGQKRVAGAVEAREEAKERTKQKVEIQGFNTRKIHQDLNGDGRSLLPDGREVSYEMNFDADPPNGGYRYRITDPNGGVAYGSWRKSIADMQGSGELKKLLTKQAPATQHSRHPSLALQYHRLSQSAARSGDQHSARIYARQAHEAEQRDLAVQYQRLSHAALRDGDRASSLIYARQASDVLRYEWTPEDEKKHPRGKGGKFTSGSGEKGGEKEDEDEKDETEEEEAEPFEWDGTINQGDVREYRSRGQHCATWDFYDDEGRHYEQTVRVVEGEYDTNPDDPDSEIVEVYRWESSQDDGYATDRGEWTTDYAEADEAGRSHAAASDMEKPEEEDEADEEENEEDEDEESDSDADTDEEGDLDEDAPPPAPAKPAFGQSKATIDVGCDESDADDMVDELFPDISDREEAYQAICSVIGAPDDSDVMVVYAGKYKTLYSDDTKMPGAKGVRVHISHPSLSECSRFIGIDVDGKKFIKNEIIAVKKDKRAGGLGLEIFAKQVENATAHGFDYISTHAAGGYGETFNGYYTWPRFGYNESVDSLAKKNRYLADHIRSVFPEAQSVRDVMRTDEVELPAGDHARTVARLDALDKKLGKQPRQRDKITGAEWWQAHGADLYNAKFDLAEGSWSQYMMANYLSKLGEKKGAASNA